MATTGSGKAESVIEAKDAKPKRVRKSKQTVFQAVKLDSVMMCEVQPGMVIEKLVFGNERITVERVKRKSNRVFVNGRSENPYQRVIVRSRNEA